MWLWSKNKLISICRKQKEGSLGNILNAGNSYVFLYFVTNYISELLLNQLFFRSKRTVLNCSRFIDVSPPKFSENKHSAENEAWSLRFLGYGFKFNLLILPKITEISEKHGTSFVIGLNYIYYAMHVLCYLPLIHITITSPLLGCANGQSHNSTRQKLQNGKICRLYRVPQSNSQNGAVQAKCA